ncbi:MAG: hypothetical protein L0229_22560 [Blastocatellia bacterium]|nr:hypothetical protein [Blastocatellia bacterium]
MISDAAIRTRLVTLIEEHDPTARVHRRRRYPKNGLLEEYKQLFVSEESNQINVYMIRRLRRDVVLRGIPARVVSATYDYGIRYYRSLIDNDDDGEASEEIAQAAVDSLADKFEADNTLALGATVQHQGLQMALDFEDVLLGDWACHRADLRLRVTVAAVNCD